MGLSRPLGSTVLWTGTCQAKDNQGDIHTDTKVNRAHAPLLSQAKASHHLWERKD